MLNADEGDGKQPRWLRRRFHAHEEELPVVAAAENVRRRAQFDDAKIKGHPVPERRRRPLVVAGAGGEVVQELIRRLPGEVAAGLWALARRVRTHQPVLVITAVLGLLGAPVLGVAAVDEDGLHGALHAVASREGAGGGTSDGAEAERALLARQIAAAARADEVPPGTLEGSAHTHTHTMKRLASELRLLLTWNTKPLTCMLIHQQTKTIFFVKWM